MIPIPTTTGCPICLDMHIPTDGAFVHACTLPGGVREFVGYVDGQVFNYDTDCTVVAAELQAHVDEIRRETDATTADMEANAHAALLERVDARAMADFDAACDPPTEDPGPRPWPNTERMLIEAYYQSLAELAVSPIVARATQRAA